MLQVIIWTFYAGCEIVINTEHLRQLQEVFFLAFPRTVALYV